MPSDDFMERADDEREMTAIADDIDDLDDDRDLDDHGADEEDADTVTFASLGLPEEILAAVTDMGFRVPTPIQAAAIPPLLELRDVVGIAQTGTGKTAAFGLPLLAIVDADERDVVVAGVVEDVVGGVVITTLGVVAMHAHTPTTAPVFT